MSPGRIITERFVAEHGVRLCGGLPRHKRRMRYSFIILVAVMVAACAETTTYSKKDYDFCNKVLSETAIKDFQRMNELDSQGRPVMALFYKNMLEGDVRAWTDCEYLRPHP
jgi:hypothetical protein